MSRPLSLHRHGSRLWCSCDNQDRYHEFYQPNLAWILWEKVYTKFYMYIHICEMEGCMKRKREREREREREEWATDSRGTVLALLFLGAFLRTEEGISGMGTLLPVIAEMMAVMNPPIMTVNSVAMIWAMPSAMTSAMASITAVSTVTAKMYTTTKDRKVIWIIF